MNRIKQLRQTHSISQSQLAKYIHVSAQTISSWENELTIPTYNQLSKVGQVFGVDADYLLGKDKKLYVIVNTVDGYIEAYVSGDYDKAVEVAKSFTGDDWANEFQPSDINIDCYNQYNSNVWSAADLAWTKGLDEILEEFDG